MKLRMQSALSAAIFFTAIAFVVFMSKAHAFEGAYVGGSFGGILSPVTHLGDKITDIIVSGSGTNVKDQWLTARKPSLKFSVKGGYGRIVDRLYSGVEFGVNKSRYRMRMVMSSHNVNLNTHDELNLTLRDVDCSIDYRQGYLISPTTLLFAKAGVSRNRAKLSLISDTTIKFPDVEFKHPGFIKVEKTIYPIRIGFGVEKKILEHTTVVLDYTYSRRLGSLKLKGVTSSSSLGGDVTTTHSHKMAIQATSIMIGLKRYF